MTTKKNIEKDNDVETFCSQNIYWFIIHRHVSIDKRKLDVFKCSSHIKDYVENKMIDFQMSI